MKRHATILHQLEVIVRWDERHVLVALEAAVAHARMEGAVINDARIHKNKVEIGDARKSRVALDSSVHLA